jgi:DNA-binding transcriptional MerR regulator
MQPKTAPRRLWRIGELAEATGLTVRTLRHYEQLGLLWAPTRTRGRQRLFDEKDVLRLYRICALRDLGLPLSDVARLLGGDREQIGATLSAHLLRVDAERRRLDELRKLLVQACSRVDEPVAVDEVLATIEAMSRVTRRGAARRGVVSSHDVEAQWYELGERVRACMASGERPGGERARDVARAAQRLLEAFADGDRGVLDALAHLRKVADPVDLAGWGVDMLRYLDQALIDLQERKE